MNKWLVWGVVVLYWVWPIDLVPGNPIDDIVLVWLAWNREQLVNYLQEMTKHVSS